MRNKEVAALGRFLLARIAEAEAEMEFHHDQTCGLVTHSNWSGCTCQRTEQRYALADCEAKRRIVTLAQNAAAAAADNHSRELDAVLGAQMTMMLEVLRVLAAAYDDHPDYLEAWRPWSEMPNTPAHLER